MKTVGMTLPYSNYSFERALEGVAGAGYRYVGFGLRHAGQLVPSDAYTDEEIAALRETFKRYGLSPYVMFAKANPTTPEGMKEYRRRIEVAAELEVPFIIGGGIWGYVNFPDTPLEPAVYNERHRAFVNALKELGEYAAQNGVAIALKPHTGNTRTAKVLLDTLKEIAHPSVVAFYDPGNVRFYEGIDPAEDVKLFVDAFPLLCAKDHAGARAENNFPVPGEGEVDFAAIFRHLNSIGFDGAVTVERVDGTGDVEGPEDIDRRMKKARANVEALATSAGIRLE